jgi:hypothetical protein
MSSLMKDPQLRGTIHNWCPERCPCRKRASETGPELSGHAGPQNILAKLVYI